MATKLKIGILGTCPVCEGEFKTKSERMVHHGYRRPGWGSIVGDCFAVNMPAYEVSNEGCRTYKLVLQDRIENLKAALERVPFLTHHVEYYRSAYGRDEKTQYAVGVTPANMWFSKIESRKKELRNDIEGCERTVDRMDSLIAAWVKKPLREVTEAAAEALAKAERDARVAERQAKRDAKKAKSDALQAKRDAKDEARQVHVDEFIESLKNHRDAMRNGELIDGRGGIRVLTEWFRNKKNERLHGWIFLNEFVQSKDYEIFIELDLALPDERKGIHFKF